MAAKAAQLYGAAQVAKVIECASGYRFSGIHGADVMAQYSSEHFPLGGPNECSVPMTRWRMARFLDAVTTKGEGGMNQCPEVGEMYERLAREMPDGSVFCETGFNVGSSAATFLHGFTVAGKTKSVLHSFDMHFYENAIKLIEATYGTGRFTPHAGDVKDTMREFSKSGKRCDVVFLDAVHPLDHQLARNMVRGADSLVL